MTSAGTGIFVYLFMPVIIVISVCEPGKSRAFPARPSEVESQVWRNDLPKPYLRSAYEDHPVTVFGEEWKVTLRGGLWRPKERAPNS